MTARASSRLPAAVAVALAIAVPLLVAIAARSGQRSVSAPPGWGQAGAAGSWIGTTGALALLPVAVIVGVPLFFVVQVLGRRRRDELQRAGLLRRPSRAARAVAAAITVAAVWLIYRGALHLPTGALDRVGGLLGRRAGSSTGTGAPHRAGGVAITSGQWLVAGVCWTLLAVAAVIWWRWRARAAPTVEPLPVAAAVPQQRPQTLDEIRAERDPTRAVIGAYALMESLLEHRGAGRRPWEAPLEYLRRVRRELPPAAAAAGVLTGLYQRARFGGRGVDDRARSEALAAVEGLAADGEAVE